MVVINAGLRLTARNGLIVTAYTYIARCIFDFIHPNGVVAFGCDNRHQLNFAQGFGFNNFAFVASA
jgi:hypothetical protein